MRPLAELPDDVARGVRILLTDVDDTLTEGSRLAAATYAAMERLQDAGVAIIPVTAAPAGWCDLMARMWPVAGVIGENGGLFFRHDSASGMTRRAFWMEEAERAAALARLGDLAREVLGSVPGSRIAPDQPFRLMTLAMTAPADRWDEIVGLYRAAGAAATLNSLWALAWFGGFDKLAMIRRVLGRDFGVTETEMAEKAIYVGDSLNDEPQFGFFRHSVGVANVRCWLGRMDRHSAYVTDREGGAGFVELAERLLAAR